jgi:hypothetical protein
MESMFGAPVKPSVQGGNRWRHCRASGEKRIFKSHSVMQSPCSVMVRH